MSSQRFLGDLSATDVQAAAGTLLSMLQSSGADQNTHTECSAFQTAYNGDGGSPQIAVDGQYGPCTQQALQATLNAGPNQPPQMAPASAFPGVCTNGQYVAPGGGSGGGSGGGGAITPSGGGGALSTSSLPTWAWWVIGGAIVLGGAAIWWMLKHHKRGGGGGGHRRMRRHVRRHSRETPKPARKVRRRRK